MRKWGHMEVGAVERALRDSHELAQKGDEAQNGSEAS